MEPMTDVPQSVHPWSCSSGDEAGGPGGRAIDQRLADQGGEGTDMSLEPREIRSHEVFSGPIFTILDKLIELPQVDGSVERIRRQLIHHDPCVVMLVHDLASDTYLLTREYRVGAGRYVHGLPAGFMDRGETPVQAALRELHEETGLVPGDKESTTSPAGPPEGLAKDAGFIDPGPGVYSSLGMSDEFGHIMVIHLSRWHKENRHFDPGEHIQSTWVTWEELVDAGIQDSKAVVAIQHEAIRRLQEGKSRASRI